MDAELEKRIERLIAACRGLSQKKSPRVAADWSRMNSEMCELEQYVKRLKEQANVGSKR